MGGKSDIRNLKKVLTLVLTVAMLLSVMVVGTGAAFSDQDSIKNKEAVDVCVALNIIAGMEDGSYRPANNVTRAQMCKMICVALNGGKEPTLGTNNTPTFNDVRTDPSSSWAESFIESCYSQGIVSGVGSGRFSPSGSVTGTQAARMLLVALGYRADLAGFTGDSWAINVNTAASAKGLYKGIESIDANAALSRDNAAQMIWNALNAYEVEYVSQLITDKDGKLTSTLVPQDKVVGGTRDKITLLADKYEAVTETGILNSVKFDSSDKTYTTKISGITSAFDATQDYSSLMGQEVKAMYTTDNKTKDTVLLGIYATAKNQVITAIKGDITGKIAAGQTVKIDGTEYDFDNTAITVVGPNGEILPAADIKAYHEVALVDNDKDKDYDYVIVNPFDVVKVNSLTAKKAYFEAAEDNTRTYNPDIDDVASYSGMAEDDYAYLTKNTYTVSGDWEAVKADTVSGKVAGIKGSDPNQSIQVSGSWYKQAAPATKVTVPNNGDDLEYAVVANGYFFATEGSTGSADRLALVLKVGDGDFDSDYRNVKMLLSDGTTTTTKAYVKNGGDKNKPDVGVLYTYTSNSDGYVLKAITDGANIGMDSDIIDDANTKYSSTTNKVGTKRVAADAKVFVLSEGLPAAAPTSYTGKLVTGATADKWADDDYDVKVAFTDGNVKIMVVDMVAAKIPNATDDSLYGVILSDPYTSTDDDGDTFYNIDMLTEKGVVDGIQIKESEFDSAFVKNQLVSYKMDGDTYVEFAANPDSANAVVAEYAAVTNVDGKYVTIKTATGTVELKVDADDSTILYVDTDAGTAATGEIKKASKKDDTEYYANIMVIYKKAADNDESHVIWGAAVDVNNMLQDEDGEDVTVAIATP